MKYPKKIAIHNARDFSLDVLCFRRLYSSHPDHHGGLTMHRDTYFINSRNHSPLFHSERNAELFLDGILAQGKFLLHAFVLMPNHFHAIITPRGCNTFEDCLHHLDSLSSSMESGSSLGQETSQYNSRGRRIRNIHELTMLLDYVERNPLTSGLAKNSFDFAFSSTNPRFYSLLDELPAALTAAAIPDFAAPASPTATVTM